MFDKLFTKIIISRSQFWSYFIANDVDFESKFSIELLSNCIRLAALLPVPQTVVSNFRQPVGASQ